MFSSDATPEDTRFKQEIFERVVLYICSEVDNIRDLSLTKLHKILYYADREVYLATGEPLTGETYVKNDHGPFSVHLEKTLDRLEDKGHLERVRKTGRSGRFGQYTQNCFISKEPADISDFTPEQVDLLNDVAQEIRKNHTAETISEVSHDVVWKTASKSEPLPYFTSYLQVTEDAADHEDIEWGRGQAEKRQ
jgi:hypothetical protein